MLADFLKDCLSDVGSADEQMGMGRARQMIPEVFFMPEHVFLSYLGVKQIP